MPQFINTKTGEDDLSEAQVRAAFPNVSFCEADFPPAPFAERHPADQPSFNAITQDVVRSPSALVDGVWTQQWSVVDVDEEVAAQRLADAINAAVLQIDADADAIREAVLGGRTTEYQDALEDALAFEAAGFTGTVPPGVKSWLDAKTAVGAGWTAQEAAQDILDTGTSWKTAQVAIRAARLLRKEQIRVATTQAEIDTAKAAWAGFVAFIRPQLGLPVAP